ncbi:MAG: glutamate--tRNA ligase [Patescibacteria group bacterium]
MKNRVRIAPSPTGFMHLGTARATLFNYLFIKNIGGEFILRIDDTDKERCQPEYEASIIKGLKWLGLNYDDIYYQSKNKDKYSQAIVTLLENNSAYWSQEENPKPGQSPEVIRFRNPGGEIVFEDLIHGSIKFKIDDLGDFIIAKNLEQPLYHLASIVDDIDSEITHIIRGDDHIANTPRQILLWQALTDKSTPQWAHIPMILAPDKSKLSKRHGAVSLLAYKEEGYLPEAMINFLALLGWTPQAKTPNNKPTDKEIFGLEELIKRFHLSGISKNGAIFNIDKLNWINQIYLKKQSTKEMIQEIPKYWPETEKLSLQTREKFWNLVVERIHTLHQLAHPDIQAEWNFILNRPKPDPELIKNPLHLKPLADRLSEIPANNFTAENIKEKIWNYATEEGRGEVLWPMRTALTGLKKSTDPFSAAELLGSTETLHRLKIAEESFKNNE